MGHYLSNMVEPFRMVAAALFNPNAFATLAALGSAAAVLIGFRRSLRFLGKDEQLRVEQLTDLVVYNGPCLKLLLPFTYKSAEVVKADTLGTMDYAKIIDTLDGSERIEKGPKLMFLGAYDKVVERAQGFSLSTTDYLTIENRMSGEKRVQRGPCVYFPDAQETCKKGAGISLNSTEYVLIDDKETGGKSVEKGPCVWFPKPSQEAVGGKKKCGISLSGTEYVHVENKETGETRIEKGPSVWFPGPQEEGKKGVAVSLGSTDYIIVDNKLTGEKRVEKGPCVWFPSPDEGGVKGEAISLGSTNYITVDNHLTGNKTMVKGPCVFIPTPFETPSDVQQAVALQDDEYVRLKDMASGKRWVQKGKALVFLEPTWCIEVTPSKDKAPQDKGRQAHGIRKAWVLKSYEYVRLIDSVTGKVTQYRGEATVFPGPDEQVLDDNKLCATDLKVNEYVKVLDKASGEIRVVAGPNMVFLGPHEMELDGGKQKAIEVDDQHAVLVRNKSTGQQRLVTENALFIPGPHEAIEKVQELIKLAEHEAMIIKDKAGHFHYYFGAEDKQTADTSRSFFLPPNAEVVKLCWSRGRRREKRDLYIDKFDCRAQYMSFEFNCRTKDNVELVLEGTFFWEVVDLRVMVSTTGDTSGDICNHARSQFIKHVAKATLKEFMEDLNTISNKVYEEDNKFYETRGVKVHSLEVTGYQCAEETTSKVLQQIIAETTNRMNRLSQQESANEVKLFEMQGQIEQQKLNGDLLEIQHQHAQKEAQVQGRGEADRVSAFMDGLAKDVPKQEDRISMWQTLRKNEALQVLSQGAASLYFTPSDVNLSIETQKS